MTTPWFALVIGLVGAALALGSPPPRLRQDRGHKWRTRQPLLVGALVVEVVAIAAKSPALAVATPLVTLMAHFAVTRLRSRKARQRSQRAMPAFTDELAQHLRSGGSLSSGFVRVSRESPDIFAIVEPVVRGVEAGERIEVALERFQTPDEALRLVLLTVRILITTGGPASAAIDRVGENVRAVIASDEEAKALAGQGTASATVLAILPLGFAALAALSSNDIARFYAFEWSGAACVAASLALTGASWFWIDALMWGKK